jgi:uncharacterized membrane protein YoaK (UPF0700 family)
MTIRPPPRCQRRAGDVMIAAKNRSETAKEDAMLRACILAIVAGYADTVGYLRLDAFAGLMTGNTVLLGIALAENNVSRALHYGAIILVFFFGVVVSRLLLRSHLSPTVCLTLAAAGLALSSFLEPTASALVLAFAMGLQNAAATRFGRVSLNTVFITGNLQKFGEGLVGLLWPGQGRHAEAPPAAVAIYGLVWLTYAVGAFLGAVAEKTLAWPLLAPAIILPFVFLGQGEAAPTAGKSAPPRAVPDSSVSAETTPGNDVRKRRDTEAEQTQINAP